MDDIDIISKNFLEQFSDGFREMISALEEKDSNAYERAVKTKMLYKAFLQALIMGHNAVILQIPLAEQWRRFMSEINPDAASMPIDEGLFKAGLKN